MKIGIIGSGNVGGTLGKRWARCGHQVVFSSRNPEAAAIQELVEAAGPTARAALAAETVLTSDILLLATPWPATREIVEGLGRLDGKILIDATNPLLPRLAGLEHANTTSGAEHIAEWASGARVVKAFNTIGREVMENPQFPAGKAVMFYCGDDTHAKSQVRQLADDLGFDARDAGPLQQARLLEPFALLWISLAMVQGYGRQFGFQFMNR